MSLDSSFVYFNKHTFVPHPHVKSVPPLHHHLFYLKPQILQAFSLPIWNPHGGSWQLEQNHIIVLDVWISFLLFSLFPNTPLNPPQNSTHKISVKLMQLTSFPARLGALAVDHQKAQIPPVFTLFLYSRRNRWRVLCPVFTDTPRRWIDLLQSQRPTQQRLLPHLRQTTALSIEGPKKQKKLHIFAMRSCQRKNPADLS